LLRRLFSNASPFHFASIAQVEMIIY